MSKGLKLQTVVETPQPPFAIGCGDRVAVVGSCFAENIGSRLSLLNEEVSLVGQGTSGESLEGESLEGESLVGESLEGGSLIGESVVGESLIGQEILRQSVIVNPCGIVYNPLSVSRSFEIMRRGEKFSEGDLVERDGLFHSMQHHGKFSHPTAQEVLSTINRPAVEALDYIIITLGTIYTYFYKGVAVANCHKLPEKEFERRALSLEEVTSALKGIAELYPEARIIITVSPIRHLRDGLSQNSLSKATLRVAASQFCALDPTRRVYFPSFEIMIDELRDYRFTESDMCHPTQQARDYIWQRFSELYLADSLRMQLYAREKELRHLAHRPLR